MGIGTVSRKFMYYRVHVCFIACIIVLSSFSCAGSSYVRAVPDVDRSDTRINAPLVIIIDKQIRDDYNVTGSVKTITIRNYRKTLQNALKETFEPNFLGIEFKDSVPGNGIYLHLRQAKPIQVQHPSSINLDIQYRVAIGSDGEERSRLENLAKGRFQATLVFQMRELLKDSVEVMCEDMYNQIFKKRENLAVFALKGKQYEISTKYGKQRIAIMNFKGGRVISNDEAKYLTDTVRTGLIKTDLFDVVTNDQIAEMIKMEEIREVFGTDCESKNCQINLGRALECKYVVVGSIQHAFKQYSIAVKILNVTDQKYLHAEEISVGDKNQLPVAARKVVDLITGKRQ